jgi:cytochrome c-type biogenesis protein CcsB
VSVNSTLANVSGDFLIFAIVVYSLAVLAFAGDFAFGRPRRSAAAATKRVQVPQLATVGAPAVGSDGGSVPAAPREDVPERRPTLWRAARDAGSWVVAGLVLSTIGVTAHVIAVVTRGLAVHRVPWGNMYEFVVALTCVAAIFFLGVMLKYRAWALGVFVMGTLVVALGLAQTLIYTAAGPLVPALQSYWLAIHVAAMALSTGIFFVAAVLGIIYLWTERQSRKGTETMNGILARLPAKEQLDRLTYRTVVFGFPVWTFGVIAGAIWADQAWGRYWGWDPVETWAFITWVLYAAFLHARATAGWRGRRAHYVQLLGFASLMFNIFVVQTLLTGLHSYAGLPG